MFVFETQMRSSTTSHARHWMFGFTQMLKMQESKRLWYHASPAAWCLLRRRARACGTSNVCELVHIAQAGVLSVNGSPTRKEDVS